VSVRRGISRQELKESSRAMRADLAEWQELAGRAPCDFTVKIRRPLLRRLVGGVLRVPDQMPCPHPATWAVSVRRECSCATVRMTTVCETHHEEMIHLELVCTSCGGPLVVTWAERLA
jgi:hypothetical protein